MILALTYAMERLRHYFEAHKVVVLTSFPVESITCKARYNKMGNKVGCKMSTLSSLSNHEKGKLYQDFLLEYEEQQSNEAKKKIWKINVDETCPNYSP